MSSIQPEKRQEQGNVDSERRPDADGPSDEGELTPDEIFHILQNGRRRKVLRYLRNTHGPVRMRDIAEQVAAWEHDTTVEDLSSDQRQRVYIPLYQSHLPKLDKKGVIDYQKNRGIVERKPLADQLYRHLEADVEDEPDAEASLQDSRWIDYYIGATGLAAVLLFGAVFELPILSTVSGIGLSAMILLIFALLTAGRYVN